LKMKSLVVRPRQGLQNKRGLNIGAVGWLLASLLYSFRFHGSSRVVVVCVGIALAVTVVGLLTLSRRRVKLTLIDGNLIFSGLLRDRVLFTKGSVGRVAHVEVDWGKASGRQSRLWLLINATGKTAVGLNRELWDGAQLENIRESLGLPVEIADAPKRPVELRKAFPGSIPWWAAHLSVATVFAIMVVAVLVLTFEGLTS
jgi:hypothetical protein